MSPELLLSSGFPLLVIPGGGLNSTVADLATHPFDEFKNEYRALAADLRNPKAVSPQVRSIGGPFIWNPPKCSLIRSLASICPACWVRSHMNAGQDGLHYLT
jgi:hypothetical protein